MKSEERHRLKHNELADSILEIPDFVKKHGSLLATGLLVLIIIGVGVFWLSKLNADSNRVQNDLLGNSLANARQLQRDMVSQIEAGEDPLEASSIDYLNKSKALVSTFSELGQEGVSSQSGITAMLEEAKILMSKLYFSTDALDEPTRNSILDRAGEIYQKIRDNSGRHKMASGMATMGLALVAENREQWDKAMSLYTELSEDKEQKWAGTPYPLQATIRLPKLDAWRDNIMFSPASDPVTETEEGAGGAVSELDDTSTGQ